MFLKQVFEKTNDYFNSITFKQRLILFFMPFVIFCALVYHLEKIEEKDSRDIKRIELLKNKIDLLNSSNNKNLSLINLLKKSEDYALTNSLILHQIQIDKQTMQLQVSTSLLKLLKLIDFIENYNEYSYIKSMSLSSLENGQYKSSLEIIFSSFMNKEATAFPILLHSKNSSSLPIESKMVDDLQLEAVIGDFVLINQKWYQLKDNVFEYELVKIESNFVDLKLKSSFYRLMLVGYENDK